METNRKGANQEMSAAELSAWHIGFAAGRRLPQINANASADGSDEIDWLEANGITGAMSADERSACVRGAECGRNYDDDDDEGGDE